MEASTTAKTVFTGRLPLQVGIIELAMPENQSNAKAGCEAGERGEKMEKERRTGRVDVHRHRTRYHSQVYIKTVVCRENNPG